MCNHLDIAMLDLDDRIVALEDGSIRKIICMEDAEGTATDDSDDCRFFSFQYECGCFRGCAMSNFKRPVLH